MDKMLTLKPDAKDKPAPKAELAAMFAEMERLNVRIEMNQAETVRLRAETRAMLGEIRETLGMTHVA